MGQTQDWIVGMDFSTRSHGVLRFAKWLHDHSRGALRMLPVFVESDVDVGYNNALGSGPDLSAKKLEGEKILGQLGVADDLMRLEVTHGAPEKALPLMVEQRRLSGLMIGRAAEAKARWSFVSLGKAARRILRHLTGPVAIVPPDFDPARERKGPILVGVAPDETSVEAVKFARELARHLDHPLLMVHAISDDPKDQEDIHGWARSHGFEGLAVEDVVGHPAWTLYDVSRERSAPMIVCGTRRLSTQERVFSASVSHDLAAHAEVPVFVVPPS